MPSGPHGPAANKLFLFAHVTLGRLPDLRPFGSKRGCGISGSGGEDQKMSRGVRSTVLAMKAGSRHAPRRNSPFMDVRRRCSVDQEADQFRATVVTACIHHSLAPVDFDEVEIGNHLSFTFLQGLAYQLTIGGNDSREATAACRPHRTGAECYRSIIRPAHWRRPKRPFGRPWPHHRSHASPQRVP